MQKLERILVRLPKSNNIFKLTPSSFKLFTTDKSSTDALSNQTETQNDSEEKKDDSLKQDQESPKQGGSAEAFAKYTAPIKPKVDVRETSFATLLRNSNLMHLGDPEGKLVEGKIFHIVKNDLYIDFGWKFPCVCSKPVKNNRDYVRGAIVRLRIKDLELSTKFLGASQEVTLLEADCVLSGLISTPNKIREDGKTVVSTEAELTKTTQ